MQVDLCQYHGYRVEISLADARRNNFDYIGQRELPVSVSELERLKDIARGEGADREFPKFGYLAVVGPEAWPFWTTHSDIEVANFEDIQLGKIQRRVYPEALMRSA